MKKVFEQHNYKDWVITIQNWNGTDELEGLAVRKEKSNLVSIHEASTIGDQDIDGLDEMDYIYFSPYDGYFDDDKCPYDVLVALICEIKELVR